MALNQADVNSHPFYRTTIEDRRYNLTGNVASQPTIALRMTGKYEDDNVDQSTVLRMPAISNFSIVGLNVNWFSPWIDSRAGMSTVPQLASIAAVEASTTTVYFLDVATRTIHLKLRTDGINRVYIDRR